MSDDASLEALEGWIAGLTARLKPGERMRLARKVGTLLRRANAKRIAANLEPEGGAMEARKPRPAAKQKRRSRRQRRMFPKMGKLRALRIRARPDGVELGFDPAMARVAAVHHYGLVDKVDARTAGSARVRYPQRRLLGLAPADRDAIMDEVLNFLGD